MCTCVILSLLWLVINIVNIIVDILKIRQNELEIYLEEGPVPKAPATLFALVDIVGCLRTTVDVGRGSQLKEHLGP